MQDHFHTGVVHFAFNGLSAILFIWLLRMFAAWLVNNGYEGMGAKLGALVNFA